MQQSTEIELTLKLFRGSCWLSDWLPKVGRVMLLMWNTSVRFRMCGCYNEDLLHELVSWISWITWVNSRIVEITVPHGVTSIPNYFFPNSSVISVEIPDTVTSIGDEFMLNCPRLKLVRLSEKLRYIGVKFLYKCFSIDSIEIPDTVTVIPDEFMNHCNKLKLIKLPKQLSSIGESFLANCWYLSSIDIPKTIISVGKHFLSNCPIGFSLRYNEDRSLKEMQIGGYVGVFSHMYLLDKVKAP